MLHLEGAEPIGPGLDELLVLHAAGPALARPGLEPAERVRDGVPFELPRLARPGPRADGRSGVRWCARAASWGSSSTSPTSTRGILGRGRAERRAARRLHSAAHALCASPRNLADDQLRAIGERDGLVGINFHVAFLRATAREDAATPLARIAEHAATSPRSPARTASGLGSDFDGAIMPAELGDVRGLPRLLDALAAGASRADELEGIAWENWRRVLAAAWAA